MSNIQVSIRWATLFLIVTLTPLLRANEPTDKEPTDKEPTDKDPTDKEPTDREPTDRDLAPLLKRVDRGIAKVPQVTTALLFG